MKTIFILIGILFMTSINAQKFDCTSKTKEYQDFYQQNKISESFSVWSEVRKNCPKENELIYTEGIQILQYKIDNAATDEEKEKLVRDAMKLYVQYNKNFPLKTADFEIYKAMVLYNNNIDSKEEIFNLLNSGFLKAEKDITNAKAIHLYFTLFFEKYKAGETKISADDILDKYTQVISMLSNLETSNPEKAEEYKTAEKGIRALARSLQSCENLVAFYDKRFEAKKENSDWLSAALTNLTAKCGAEPIYYKIAETNYKLKATSKSAYNMGIASVKIRKFIEAIQFFTEAESLETNILEKAKMNYSLATGLLNNDKQKSKEHLLKALKLDPNMTRAYLYLSEMYANSAEECGKTETEKKAIYYLALETAKKAANTGAKIKAAADKMIEKYAVQTLTSAEISKQKLNGKSIKIECWINETITFPSK